MNKIYGVFGFLIVCGIVGMVYLQVIKPYFDNQTVSVVVPRAVEFKDLNFSFTYPSGEGGYALIEPPLPPSTADGLEKVLILMSNQEYIEYSLTEDLSETPPTVTLFILKEQKEIENTADRVTRLETWAKENPQYTSFSGITSEVKEVDIDGVKALQYQAVGTYNQDIYLVSYRGYLYVFVGQHDDVDDEIYLMYQDLIQQTIFH